MNNADIYQKVTDKILEGLEQGVVAWRKPWRSYTGSVERHANLVTKRPYTGINQILLLLEASLKGYTSPYWLTFKQIKAKGGKVRKGEKASMVIFWKPIRIKTDEVTAEGKPVYRQIPLLKYYNVFNTDQCDALKVPEPEEAPQFDPIDQAQAIIDNMPDRPRLGHDGGDRAYYAPRSDSVHMPLPEAFYRRESYYLTTYHELAHSTGHESRLGRVESWERFGSDPYAKEELVAEMTAAMVSAVAGIEDDFTPTVSYIESWSRRFREDPRIVVGAAAQAQKAADYILGERKAGEAQAEVAEAELVVA